MSNTKNKPMGLFGLTMLTVIAIDSLRTLSIGAEYGFALVFFYIVLGITFFIPSILISAELATGWPNTGGAYVWIREAFGAKWSFFAIWLLWICVLTWFPVIFSFIGSIFSTLIDHSLEYNKWYMLSAILILVWLSTGLSCIGMRVAGWVNITGAVFGTILPMLIIILLGLWWYFSGKPLQIVFSLKTFIPDFKDINSLVLLTNVLFGLLNIEISATHAGDVLEPEKNYPKAFCYAGIIIFFSFILASLAIAIVIPQKEISLIGGLMEAFKLFFTAFHLPWMTNIIAVSIILGSFSAVSAWILAPTRSLQIACQDMSAGKFLNKLNKKGMPVNILIIQAIIVSILSAIFLLMPNVNSAYWIMSSLTAQFALLYYILLFASAIRLRYKKTLVERFYRVPVGNIGIWICGILGIITCVFTIGIGFLPPSQIQVGKIFRYEAILIIGTLFFCFVPLLIYKTISKKSI